SLPSRSSLRHHIQRSARLPSVHEGEQPRGSRPLLLSSPRTALMKLPENRTTRFGIYRDLIRKCESSRTSRRSKWRRMRSWLLLGSDAGVPARHNAIEKLVNISTAHLFAPERIRFGVILPPHYGDQWIEEEDGARLELQRLWNHTDNGIVELEAVRCCHALYQLNGKGVVDWNIRTM